MWSQPWPVDHVMVVPVPPRRPWVFQMNRTGTASGLYSGLGVHMAFLAVCCHVLLKSHCGYYSDITEPSLRRAREMSISLFLLGAYC